MRKLLHFLVGFITLAVVIGVPITIVYYVGPVGILLGSALIAFFGVIVPFCTDIGRKILGDEHG